MTAAGRRPHRRRLTTALVGLMLSAPIAAACGADSAIEAEDGMVSAGEAWIAPTPPGADAAAFYLTIVNRSGADDRLLSASSSRCGVAEIHQSEEVDGLMSMGPASIEKLDLPDGEQLTLEPLGLHVMCRELVEPVVAGESIDLTLEFDRAGPVTVTAVAEQR